MKYIMAIVCVLYAEIYMEMRHFKKEQKAEFWRRMEKLGKGAIVETKKELGIE